MYTNKDISERFGISRETARLWSNQFADYLSPTATPQAGRQRNYTDDDLSVFALVASLKGEGKQNDEISAALASGQRGTVPTVGPVVPRATEVATLKRQLAQVVNELTDTRELLLKSEGKVELLQQQLADKESTIRQLYREIARLEAAQDDQ